MADRNNGFTPLSPLGFTQPTLGDPNFTRDLMNVYSQPPEIRDAALDLVNQQATAVTRQAQGAAHMVTFGAYTPSDPAVTQSLDYNIGQGVGFGASLLIGEGAVQGVGRGIQFTAAAVRSSEVATTVGRGIGAGAKWVFEAPGKVVDETGSLLSRAGNWLGIGGEDGMALAGVGGRVEGAAVRDVTAEAKTVGSGTRSEMSATNPTGGGAGPGTGGSGAGPRLSSAERKAAQKYAKGMPKVETEMNDFTAGLEKDGITAPYSPEVSAQIAARRSALMDRYAGPDPEPTNLLGQFLSKFPGGTKGAFATVATLGIALGFGAEYMVSKGQGIAQADIQLGALDENIHDRTRGSANGVASDARSLLPGSQTDKENALPLIPSAASGSRRTDRMDITTDCVVVKPNLLAELEAKRKGTALEAPKLKSGQVACP